MRPFSGLAPSKLVAFVDISILHFQKNRRKGPCGTEKSVVLRGLKKLKIMMTSRAKCAVLHGEDDSLCDPSFFKMSNFEAFFRKNSENSENFFNKI